MGFTVVLCLLFNWLRCAVVGSRVGFTDCLVVLDYVLLTLVVGLCFICL